VTGILALVRVTPYKNTGSVKLLDADNVKGGALAATYRAHKTGVLSRNFIRQGFGPAFSLKSAA
jgi:hypothetical protein